MARMSHSALPARRPAQSSKVISAKSWKSMAMYQSPADSESNPSTLCNSSAWAASCASVGRAGIDSSSIHTSASAAPAIASAMAAK
ncbi:MAG: hypothetical protein MUE63_15080 [Xanthomonadales bacterium]|nr:hypothetical protein [Xanthomonadales bacterium]